MPYRFAATLAAATLSCAAIAAPADSADVQHPWVTLPLRTEQPATYFTNLKDGERIETPYLLKFGLSRYGLSPIVKDVPKTGHHHMLVNRELPLDFTQPLPFNDQYIHFGKGQMETVLTFAPGTYTLRLLLADHKHIPFFIYSKPMTITVTAKNDSVDPKTLVKPGVAMLAPRAGDTLQPPFLVQMHASGLNVGHVDVKEPGVGHFRIVAERVGGGTEQVPLANGLTQVWLNPPPGDYRMRLELVRNAAPQDVMATSEAMPLKVARK
jgi:hypothetical protein